MIETFKKLLQNSNRVLVTSHKSPDGDAVGSSVACYEFLKSIGKEPFVLLPDPPASNLMPYLEGVDYSFYENHNLDFSQFVKICTSFSPLSQLWKEFCHHIMLYIKLKEILSTFLSIL